ncbi:hypothetical protein CJ030_MR2G013450 [Morella rubra]|uniref:Uncharacterized protein n=1 Tax=Morella rubra TaxID=262757 RepID=A0A6A1WBG4_9ROSI|nr:hypothetical protein CJ030_MR2G013450 [Morella rubra]
MELLNLVPVRLPFLTATSEVRALALRASRWSLRLKSSSRVLFKDKKSICCNWRVVLEASGSSSEESRRRASDSGHERRVCWLFGRGLGTRVWY